MGRLRCKEPCHAGSRHHHSHLDFAPSCELEQQPIRDALPARHRHVSARSVNLSHIASERPGEAQTRGLDIEDTRLTDLRKLDRIPALAALALA